MHTTIAQHLTKEGVSVRKTVEMQWRCICSTIAVSQHRRGITTGKPRSATVPCFSGESMNSYLMHMNDFAAQAVCL